MRAHYRRPRRTVFSQPEFWLVLTVVAGVLAALGLVK